MIWSQLGQHQVDTDLVLQNPFSTLYFKDDISLVLGRGYWLGCYNKYGSYSVAAVFPLLILLRPKLTNPLLIRRLPQSIRPRQRRTILRPIRPRQRLTTPRLSSNERKKPPNLEAKIPRKNRKAKESLPGNKRAGDDPLSRIDPSLPLVPVARLPGKKAENVVDAEGQKEEPPMPPSSSKGTTARLSPQDRRRKQQLLLKKKAETKKQAEVVATAMAMANLSMDADEPSDT
jgi:hypothetical protein